MYTYPFQLFARCSPFKTVSLFVHYHPRTVLSFRIPFLTHVWLAIVEGRLWKPKQIEKPNNEGHEELTR